MTALDHERLPRLLRRMCSPGPSQERWRAEFVGLLLAHRVAESDVVIGALVARVESLALAAREQAERDVELDRLAERAQRLDLGSHGLEDFRQHADALLAQHADRWEIGLMAPLEEQVARSEVRRLGGAYEQRRDAELLGAGVVHAPPRRLDLSRAELYELARKAGIEGRSAMTRNQLIDELQRRGHG
ncbi:MAG: Rho termination factor N-terminal domain-containing protein [Actinomycetes bacterium]